MPRLAVLACVSSLLLLAACGGSSASGGGDDPASLVPRDAAVYFEATLRPEGDLRDGALEAAGKVLRTDDPQKRIDELLQEAFAESDGPEIDYDRDVKPWLGEKGGVWAASTKEGEEEKVVAILSATDTDKAQEAIDRLSEESGKRFSERSYEDVDYKLNDEGQAVGIVDDFAVLGTEAEFKRTVRAASEDEGLASDDRYEEAIDELPGDRLAHFYANAQGLIRQALAQEPEGRAQAEQLLRGLGVEKLGPIAASFSADGSRLAIDGFTSGGNDYFKRFGALTGTGSTPLLGELPGDAWGALGAPKLGETARTLYQQFAGALGGAAIAQQLRTELGLDLERDVFSWIGDVAFFVRGTSPTAIDGGAVIEVTDRDKAKAAFGKLVGVLQARGGVNARPVTVKGATTAFELSGGGSPQKVVAALGDGRVAIGAGAAAAADALSPSEKLADGELYGEAKSLLGGEAEPGFLLSMPDVVELGSAMSSGDPEWAEVKPYLEAFSLIASGGKLEDDRAVSRFAAGLK